MKLKTLLLFLLLFINIDAQLTCSYTSTNIHTGVGLTVSLVPTCSEEISMVSVEPVLPDGLKLNPTGSITGSPTLGFSAVTFTVTFANLQDTTTTSFQMDSIALISSCDFGFTVNSAINVVHGVRTSFNGPSCIPTVNQFIIRPDLPSGLILDKTTGRISGVANETIPPTKYVLTAKNIVSEYNINFELAVIEKTEDLFLPGAEFQISAKGFAINNYQPSKGIYWDLFDNNEVPDVLSLILTSLEQPNDNNFKPRNENVLIRLQAYIYITKKGKYSFSVNGDDSIQFYWNGDYSKFIYTNSWSNWKSYPEDGSSIELDKGYYEIGAIVYQVGGGMAVQVKYLPPGSTTATTIPTDMIYHILIPVQNLQYKSSMFTFSANNDFSFTYSSMKGTATVWSIKPDLPEGISFNNGEISGNYPNTLELTTYTVTASNPLSSSSFTLSIAIYGSDIKSYMNGIIVNYYRRDRDDCNATEDKYPNKNPDIYHLVVRRVETNLKYEYKKESYDGLPGYLNEMFNVEYDYSIVLDADGNYEYDIETTDENYFWMYSEGQTGSGGTFTSAIKITFDGKTETYIRAYLVKSQIPMWMSSCRGKGNDYETGGSINMAGGPEQMARQPIPAKYLAYTPPGQFYYTYLYIYYVSYAAITPNEPIYYLLSKDDFYKYTVIPSLPYGLTIDSDTGIISGTAYIGAMDIETYTITSINKISNTAMTTTIEIGLIELDKPSNLRYYDTVTSYPATSIEFAVNQEINTLEPQLTNSEAVRYYTQPSLPSGIVIDPYSGIISGKPRETYGSIVTIYADRKGLITSTTLTVIISQCGLGLQYFEIYINTIDTGVKYSVYHNDDNDKLLYQSNYLQSNTQSQYSYCGSGDNYKLKIESTAVESPSFFVYIGSTLVRYEKLKSGKQTFYYQFTNSISYLPSIEFGDNNVLTFYYYLESSYVGQISNGIDSVVVDPPLPNSLALDTTTMTITGIVDNIGDTKHSLTLKNIKGSKNVVITIHSISCPEGNTAFYVYFYGNEKSSEAIINLKRDSDDKVLLDYNGNLKEYERTSWYFCEKADNYTLTLSSTNKNSKWNGATSLALYIEGHIEMFFGKYSSTILDNSYKIDLDFISTPSSSWLYYYSDKSDPGLGWKTLDYYDGHWQSAKLGFFNKRKGITSYYRKKFTINDFSDLSSFQAGFKFDGGIVAYLNEHEFFRHNMPIDTEITYNTEPLRMLSEDEVIFKRVSGTVEYLNIGENILAIELHIKNDSSISTKNPFGGWFDTVIGTGDKHCSDRSTLKVSTDINPDNNGWLSENVGYLVDKDQASVFAAAGTNRFVEIAFSNDRYEYINSYTMRGPRAAQIVRGLLDYEIKGFNEDTNEFDSIYHEVSTEIWTGASERSYFIDNAPKRAYNRFRLNIYRTGNSLPGSISGYQEIRDLIFYSCNIQSCPEEGEWQSTAAGSSASVSCPEGYFGNIVRKCILDNGKATWDKIPSMSESCTDSSFKMKYEKLDYYVVETLNNPVISPGLTCSELSITTPNPLGVYLTVAVDTSSSQYYITTKSVVSSDIKIVQTTTVGISAKCAFPNMTTVFYETSFELTTHPKALRTIPLKFYFKVDENIKSPDLDVKTNDMLIRYEKIIFDTVDHYHTWTTLSSDLLYNYAIYSDALILINGTSSVNLIIRFEGKLRVTIDDEMIFDEESVNEITQKEISLSVEGNNGMKKFNLFYVGLRNKRNVLEIYNSTGEITQPHYPFYCEEIPAKTFTYLAEQYIGEKGNILLENTPVSLLDEGVTGIYKTNSALPTGLNFDVSTGRIYGNPINTLPWTEYEVTATVNSVVYTFKFKLKINDTPNKPSYLHIKDCDGVIQTEFKFYRNSYLSCDGYTIESDQPVQLGYYPDYDNFTMTKDGYLNYYSDVGVDYPIYIYGMTPYGELIILTKITVVECTGSQYTVFLNSNDKTEGSYIVKEKLSKAVLQSKTIQSNSRYNYGICSSSKSYTMSIILNSGSLNYKLTTFDSIVLYDEYITCDNSEYPCTISFDYDYNRYIPKINHVEYIEYIPYQLYTIHPNSTELVAYTIISSYPNGINLNPNGILTFQLSKCIDYNLKILAKNNMGNITYTIRLRCTSCRNDNEYKVIYSRKVDYSSSREVTDIYDNKTSTLLYHEVLTNNKINIVYENTTLCVNNDLIIYLNDEDSTEWYGTSNMKIVTPMEMVLNQGFYNSKLLIGNSINIYKPLLTYNTKWKVSFDQSLVFSNNQPEWSKINYNDNSWKECVFPDCEVINGNTVSPFKMIMRKKVFIDSNIGGLYIDYIHNDSFALFLNGVLITINNAKIVNKQLSESITDHETYHNITTISNQQFISGAENIFTIYYYKTLLYDPLIQIAIYPILYDTYINPIYYSSSKDILDLLPDTTESIKCENGLKITFGFQQPVVFNSYEVMSSTLTKDIQWGLYGSLSSSNNILLSSGYGRFDDNYIIPTPLATSSYYLQINDCNSIRNFVIKDIKLTISNTAYCDENEEGYFATSINHYSIISCPLPLIGVVKKLCYLHNNKPTWSDEEDSSSCDYTAPELLQFENGKTVIEGYINTEIEETKILNYNYDTYSGVYYLPELPNGIIFDEVNGIIYGKPTDTVDNILYSILVYNKNGRQYLLFHINIRGVLDEFSYNATNAMVDSNIHIQPNQDISATSIYVYPPLPTGLNINIEGEIIGKLSTSNDITEFYVTYENPSGEMSTNVEIIVSGKPTLYEYTGSPYTISQSIQFTSGKPKIIGVIDFYSCDSLPTGLEIDMITGIISGSPQVITTSKHTCTATNEKGSISTTIWFTILERKCEDTDDWFNGYHGIWVTNSLLCKPGTSGFYIRYCSDDLEPVWSDSYDNCNPVGPTSLRYTSIITYVYKQEGLVYTPVYTGVIDQFAITPSLPDGLVFNTTNGEIYGKPNAVIENVFTITGSNENGEISTKITLIVKGRYCEEDDDWPKTLIDTSVILPCGENLIGLRRRICLGDNNEEWWENSTDHCLSNHMNQYDQSTEYYETVITFTNMTFTNSSEIDYLFIELLENKTGIKPIAFVSKDYVETDRYNRLYSLTYIIKYELHKGNSKIALEYTESLQSILDSKYFIEELGANIIELNYSYTSTTLHYEHFYITPWNHKAGYIILIIIGCFLMLFLSLLPAYFYYRKKKLQNAIINAPLKSKSSRVLLKGKSIVKSKSILENSVHVLGGSTTLTKSKSILSPKSFRKPVPSTSQNVPSFITPKFDSESFRNPSSRKLMSAKGNASQRGFITSTTVNANNPLSPLSPTRANFFNNRSNSHAGIGSGNSSNNSSKSNTFEMNGTTISKSNSTIVSPKASPYKKHIFIHNRPSNSPFNPLAKAGNSIMKSPLMNGAANRKMKATQDSGDISLSETSGSMKSPFMRSPNSINHKTSLPPLLSPLPKSRTSKDDPNNPLTRKLTVTKQLTIPIGKKTEESGEPPSIISPSNANITFSINTSPSKAPGAESTLESTKADEYTLPPNSSVLLPSNSNYNTRNIFATSAKSVSTSAVLLHTMNSTMSNTKFIENSNKSSMHDTTIIAPPVETIPDYKHDDDDDETEENDKFKPMGILEFMQEDQSLRTKPKRDDRVSTFGMPSILEGRSGESPKEDKFEEPKKEDNKDEKKDEKKQEEEEEEEEELEEVKLDNEVKKGTVVEELKEDDKEKEKEKKGTTVELLSDDEEKKSITRMDTNDIRNHSSSSASPSSKVTGSDSTKVTVETDTSNSQQSLLHKSADSTENTPP